MFRTVLGADIGSANTRFALRGECVSAATAVSPEGGKAIRSFGRDAPRAGGRVCPVREGAAANVELLALFLSETAKAVSGRRAAGSIDLYLALPRLIPALRFNAYFRAVQRAGFHSLRVLNAALMGALGAGVDVFGEKANMLVDIGAETIRCAVIANGGLVFESAESFGSTAVDRALQTHFRTEHRAFIGSRMAEIIKQRMTSPLFVVDGRSVDTGLPVSVRADGEWLRSAAEAGLKPIIRFAADSVKALRPDTAADLFDTGVTLIGGGARFAGIENLLSSELGLPVHVAENAEFAVADGMRRYLFTDASLAGRLRPDFIDAEDGRIVRRREDAC
jgi:rod shape-determining protein MreB